MFQVNNTRKPECGICMKPYNSGAQFPTIISTCGHSFCVQCCRKINQCPVCRKGFCQSALVKNFSLLQLIQQSPKPPSTIQTPPQPQPIPTSSIQNSSLRAMYCCVNDGGKIIWNSDFSGKCGVCRYDRSGCWQCIDCSFLFCMECGKSVRNLSLVCISDGSRVVWESIYNGKCGNCRSQRSGCWKCLQCGLYFCTECGINQRNMQMCCLNDGGQVVWKSNYAGKCGFCGYDRNGCWQCTQCFYLFCTQCGKNGRRMGIVCINDANKVVWQPSYNGKCSYCRVQINGCWECVQCRVVFCTKCGVKGQNYRILCINDRSSVIWDKMFSGKCAVCRYDRKGSWVCNECGIKFCTDCGKKG